MPVLESVIVLKVKLIGVGKEVQRLKTHRNNEKF